MRKMLRAGYDRDVDRLASVSLKSINFNVLFLHIWRSAKTCIHHSVFHKVLNAKCSVLIRIFVVLYSKESAN